MASPTFLFIEHAGKRPHIPWPCREGEEEGVEGRGGGLCSVTWPGLARLDVHKEHTLGGIPEGDAGVSGVERCWLEPSCNFFAFLLFRILCS